MSNDLLHEVAQSGGHEQRVTTEFKSYRLMNMQTKQITGYRIWDTWGIESENYASCEFEYILEVFFKFILLSSQGRIASKTSMKSELFRLGNKSTTQPNPLNAPHCVIFFIPVTELDNEESMLLQKTKEFMQKATEYSR